MPPPPHARTRTRTARAATVTALSAALLTVPAAASAHVTVQPGTLPGGGFSVVAFRVPNERDDASTTRLRVVLPQDEPIGFVQTTPVPGWRVTTAQRTLDEPVELFGEEVDRVVSTVTWTATGGGVRPGQFEDFEVSLGPLPESGQMSFVAVQTYSNGERVAWNQVPVGDADEPERPAPLLRLTAPEDVTTEPAADAGDDPGGDAAAGSTGSAADSADGDDRDTLPLALSALGLLTGVAALVVALTRRRAAR